MIYLHLDTAEEVGAIKSIGVYDAYKWIRKNKWLSIKKKVSEKDFYLIIRTVNKLISKALLGNKSITLPFEMGKLVTEYVPTFLKIVDGKVVTNRRIDWDLTVKLKHRVYQENEYYTFVKFVKGKFKNKQFLEWHKFK